MKDLGQVKPLCLPVIDGLVRFQYIAATDHLVQSSETELCHDLTQLLRNETHEVDDILRLAAEILAQFRILCRHAGRAGVAVAYTHHDAPQGYQRSGRKTELLGTQQCGDRNVTAGLKLTVGFNGDPAAQVVQQQGLVRLGQAEFPGETGMFDTRDR